MCPVYRQIDIYQITKRNKSNLYHLLKMAGFRKFHTIEKDPVRESRTGLETPIRPIFTRCFRIAPF